MTEASLSAVARDAKLGTASPQELFDAFISAQLYWPAPQQQPGLPVIPLGGRLVAPVFSSERELVKFIGPGKWLSATGLELLSILPSKVTIGLDLASDHRVQLDPAAVRLAYELVLTKHSAAPAGDGSRDAGEEQRR